MPAPQYPRAIQLRIKAAHAETAARIWQNMGHSPIHSREDSDGSVLFRFGATGDDLCYAITSALPLDYFDIRGARGPVDIAAR